MLSGCEHEVITGISLKSSSEKDVFSVITQVTFRELEDAEIDYYIRTLNHLTRQEHTVYRNG